MQQAAKLFFPQWLACTCAFEHWKIPTIFFVFPLLSLPFSNGNNKLQLSSSLTVHFVSFLLALYQIPYLFEKSAVIVGALPGKGRKLLKGRQSDGKHQKLQSKAINQTQMGGKSKTGTSFNKLAKKQQKTHKNFQMHYI